ncbi:F-box only protein 47-like isoform X3 [Centruroides vittatus]|uniref:F-box only protein 47-like isoform X3 n=1 Tax=Centruroides vittatus TaxID=120091 RepID=UPI00350EA5B6
MSFTNFIPFAYKTLRRSARILKKEKGGNKHKKIEESLLVDDLSILTISSKAVRNQIEVYRNSSYGLKNLIPDIITKKFTFPISVALENENVMHFHKLGLLMKRSTCLYPTKQRMTIILEFINKLECNPQNNISNMTHVLQCYGKFIHTIIAGWDESECCFVHSILDNVSDMKKHLKYVLTSFPGSNPGKEMYVRMYHRFVYLDYCWNSTDRSFWLSKILKPWPLVHQAKLLFLLYGPVCSDKIQWFELTENTPEDYSEASKKLTDLAYIIQLMQQNTLEWNGDDIISILEEITDTPEEWMPENIAILLLFCGDIVAAMFMGNKLLNGKTIELANLVIYLAMACTKYDYQQKWLVQLIDKICHMSKNKMDRQKFIQMIPAAFQEIIMDIHDIDEGRESELKMLIETQTSFLSVIINRAFCQSTAFTCKVVSEE